MTPWVISPGDEERARIKAEGVEEEEEKKKIRAEARKRKQKKKWEAERRARKDAEHNSYQMKRDEREAPSETRNNKKPSTSRHSSAHENVKPKNGGKGRKERDNRAPEPRPHVPGRFDALGI